MRFFNERIGFDTKSLTPQHSVLISFCILIIQFHNLAHYPQNPDGMELINAAVYGGVLHPPGFPLQAWIDRIFIRLPLGALGFRLSLCSWLAHGATIFVLCEMMRTLRGSFIAQLVCAISYAFFPVTWELAVQPEKYALTNLLFSATLLGLCKSTTKPHSDCSAKKIGAWFGFSLSQHTMLALSLPISLATAWPTLTKGSHRFKQVFQYGLGALGVSSAFYLSLFLLRIHARWPDWGKLQNLGELVKHLLRADFHFFNLMPTQHVGGTNGLSFVVGNLWSSYFLFLIVLCLGVYFCFRSHRRLSIAIFIFLTLEVIFLRVTELPGDLRSAATYLERYMTLLIPMTALFFGLGTLQLEKTFFQYPSRYQRGIIVLPLLLFFYLFSNGWERANVSSDNTLQTYQSILEKTIDPESVWVAGSDIDAFLVLQTSKGPKFPIIGDYPWALERVTPIADPRIPIRKDVIGNGITSIMQYAYAHQLKIMSTNQSYVRNAAPMLEQQGIFWVAHASYQKPLTDLTIQGAKAACSALMDYQYVIPKEGHHYSKVIFEYFRYPFYASTMYFQKKGDIAHANLSKAISFALYQGVEPEHWINGCKTLISETKD